MYPSPSTHGPSMTPSSFPLRRATALLALALCALSPARAQQGVNLDTAQPDFTAWQLYGSATASNMTPGNGFTYSLLTLTQPGSGDQGGAGFAPDALTLDFNQPFQFSFHFYIPTSTEVRGDGLTLTLSTTPGLGNAGSGLGYESLAVSSVALAIDTFHFDGEPVSPSLQILAGGHITPLAATETGLGDTIRDPNYQWRAVLDYLPSGLDDHAGTLTGTLEHIDLGTFTVTAPIDFLALDMVGAPVFWGFTASNGLATDGHIVDWGAPVPEPASALLMLGGAAWLGVRRRRIRR